MPGIGYSRVRLASYINLSGMKVQLDPEPEPATYVDSYEFIQLFVSLPADFLC